jgi:hypothetical protein
MGNESNFCNCKPIAEEISNFDFMNNINYYLCPSKNESNKKNFGFQANNQNLTIEDYTKKSAINKIIKIYREYKKNKKSTLNNETLEYINKSNNKKTNSICSSNLLRDSKYGNQSRNKEFSSNGNIPSYNCSSNKMSDNDNNQIKHFISDKYETNEMNNNNEDEYNKEINENNLNYNKKNTIKDKLYSNKDSQDSYRENSSSSNRAYGKMKRKSSGKQIIYVGNKVNDSKEDFGITIWNEDTKHIGYYKNNKANGYGKFIAGKNIFQGEFENDGENGYGIFNNEDETTYEGYWAKDAQEGFGIEKWKDGSIYIGEYSHGKKEGIGTYKWPDGTKYEGQWKNNTFDGYGIYYFSNDKAYFGEWKNKKKDGFGEYICPNRKYIGFYVNNKKEGFGITIWKDRHKAIVGFWKEGKQYGFGKFMNKKKSYFGIWTGNNKVEWLKNEKQGYDYLEKNGLEQYKIIFEYNLELISDYCYNNDDLENFLYEKIELNNKEDESD